MTTLRALLATVAAAGAVAGASDAAVYRVAGTAAPRDALWSFQWAPRQVGAPEAWALAGSRPAPVVAVLDTGVDATHPDLAGKLVPGYDVVNGDNDPADDHGHGTAVAGIIGSATGNGLGVASYCPSCPVMPVKVLAANGSGRDTQVAAGMIWAVDHGARVLNLSLGGPGDTAALHDAVRYARDRGAIVVAAAGNDGTSEPSYPAAYPEALAVAATDQADALYAWSNRGPWSPLAAPGEHVTTLTGGSYGVFQGTSSAAPAVAGIAALALAAAPAADARAIAEALRGTARPVEAVPAGRVDAAAALARLAPPPATRPAAAAPPRRRAAPGG